MILTCPACAMRYLVPDTAIGPKGRQVRCANCRHSWHQDAAEPEPAERPTDNRPTAPPALTAAEPRPMTNRPVAAPAAAAPAPDLMAHRAPFRGRRNPLRVASWAAGGVAALLLAVGVAALAVGREPIARALGMPVSTESPLIFVDQEITDQDRSPLPNMLILTGTIRNVSSEEQTIPAILAEGVDANDRVIYSWTFPPPQRRIGPGEIVSYNNAHAGAPDKIVGVDLSFNTPQP